MRISLLGPIAVQTDEGRPVTPTAPKRRALLSALALETGRLVPTSLLLDTVWEGKPPPTARAALHGHIAELRRLLDRRLTLTTRDTGYQLDGDPEQVDALRFERLCDRAGAAHRPDDALPLLHQALDLWRGPALADCGSAVLRDSVAPRLVELRVRALQDLGKRMCQLGRGAELVPELTEALAADPTREQLAAQLMDCLDQAGRRAEALAVHQRTTERLHADLGAAEGPALRAARERLTPRRRAVLSQLPRRNRRFVGRSAELGQLDRLTGPAAGGPADRHPVLVTGPAGVGKTSLVLHWAHQAVDRFPDGLLHADLRGFDETEPRDPAEVLAGFLTALGVPENQLPGSLDDRSHRYRELLAGRQLLVLLDNARDYRQLAPLLPAAEDTPVTVITSRSRLGDLLVQAGAVPLPLDVLTPDEALELLRRVLDPQRIAAEPAAAAEIAERCDHLPLALRLATARLAARPDWTLRHLAEEISDEQSRLAALTTAGSGSLGITATLNLTRRALGAQTERFFGYLGLHPGAVIDPHAAAVLADVPPVEARMLLAQLDAAHLVEETAPGLFARHDLVRLYGAELAGGLAPAQREAAMERMLDHYLAATAAACAGMNTRSVLPGRTAPPPGDTLPPLGTTGQALAWFRREERAVRGLVLCAEQHGRPDLGWQLAHQACALYYHDSTSVREWRATAEAGLRCAQRGGDQAALVRTHADLAVVQIEQGDFAAAADQLERATELADRLGDPMLRQQCRIRLANGLVRAGEHARAIPLMTRLVLDARELTDQRLLAQALNNLANALVVAGDPAAALAHATEAVQLLAARPDDFKLTIATHTRAEALHALGRHHAALAAARHALALGRAQGSLRTQGITRFIATLEAAVAAPPPHPAPAPAAPGPGPTPPVAGPRT
ncbi:AfsR/SARP family transcriptional regulator [Kitasatospora viridis]|uniref:DNA-binding SARP family transcriptional activator n=1 Tax=Kitasatospora viridis TaxID=281105 RepID=A0A561UCY5_9ACTN|nr:BTAD domain-containing putative transcriptional regulator [Kitasatospora viridis]TWF97217.1 DNA-binding SARP family transcriptional activator [Kitasatospora viridis]